VKLYPIEVIILLSALAVTGVAAWLVIHVE
jgi:hypothetical protein